MLLAFSIGLLAVPTFVQLGMARGGGYHRPSGPYKRIYNSKTVETISGTVEDVQKITIKKGMSDGIHLILKSDRETISVHLGPAWFIEKQATSINKGDQIEVKGSRVTFNGKPAIIAAEVQKGAESLHLRDAKGSPVWGGWQRQQ